MAAAEKPKTVKVEALKYHTNAGGEYDIGDTYDVDDAAVDNLTHLGMAIRVDRVAHAKALQSKALKPSKSGKLKPVKAGKKAKGKGKK